MKIGIIGTRGIPNYYGGFEECAQQLAVRWVKKGHEVLVYNSHRHPYQQKEFEGVELIHKYDAEHRIGTAGQFIYDFNTIYDTRWRNFDIILQMGYTSSSVWSWLLPKGPAIITNMDGLEWKRSKYSREVQSFLKKAEKWAVDASNLLIADAEAMKDYLNEKYKAQIIYIPYGADVFKEADESVLENYNVSQGNYNLIVARLEPENNIETILKGVQKSQSERVTLVVGNHETRYGEYLKSTFRDSRIRFVKGTYKKNKILSLRYYAHLYFHGHSVGGTNPSLLEAMGCKCMICAHDNVFNREVLGDDGNYFLDENDVVNALELLEKNEIQEEKIRNNLEKLLNKYNWDSVADQYELTFEQALVLRK